MLSGPDSSRAEAPAAQGVGHTGLRQRERTRSGVRTARVTLAGASGCVWTCELVQRLNLHRVQAAAEREYVIGHPVRRAVSVRKQLRLQHAVLSEVLDGALPSRPALRPQGEGSISMDCTRHASLSKDRLHVRDLRSGRLEHAWALPQLPGDVRPCRHWAWGHAREQLVLPYGEGWLHSSEGSSAAGLLFLELATGKPVIAHLQDAGGGDELTLYPCASNSLVLVEHDADARNLSVLLQIFDCRGVLVHSLGERLPCYIPKWSSDGSSITVHRSTDSSLSVWDLASGRVVQLAGAVSERPVVWAMPHSGQVALVSMSEAPALTFAGPGLQRSEYALGMPEAFEQRWLFVAWGTRLVVELSDLHSTTWLLLYSLQEGCLSLQHTVTLGCSLGFHACQLSADGELAAMVTSFRDSAGHQGSRCLGLLHLASGRMQQYPLLDPRLSDMIDAHALRVRWMPDSAGVLVFAPDGSCCELFCFASGLV